MEIFLRKEIRSYKIPYEIVVYATDLSNDVTIAYYSTQEAKTHGNEIVPITILKNTLVDMVIYVNSNGIGEAQNVELNTANINFSKGKFVYG